MKETANNETCKLSNRQGLMKDKIIASHTYFGEHMDVNCSTSLQTFKFVWWPGMDYKYTCDTIFTHF